MDTVHDFLNSLLQFASRKEVLAVITALAGYAGGVISEPIKKSLAARSERKRLRIALYAELTKNFDSAFLFMVTPNDLKTEAIFTRWLAKYPALECYNEARQQPVLFGQLKEYGIFSSIYEVLLAIQTANTTEEKKTKDLGNLLEYIQKQVEIGKLSRKIMHDRTTLPYRFRHPVKQWLARRYTHYRWAKAQKRAPDVKSLMENWLSRYLDS